MTAKTASKSAIKATVMLAILAAAGAAEARTAATLPVIEVGTRTATVAITAFARGNADALAPNRDADTTATVTPARLALRSLNPQPLPPR